jgi:hypothetical protein
MKCFELTTLLATLLIAFVPMIGAAEETRTASAENSTSSTLSHADSRVQSELPPSKWAPIATLLEGELRSGNAAIRQEAARKASAHGEQGMELLLHHIHSGEATNPMELIPHLWGNNDAQRLAIIHLLRTPYPELREKITEHLAHQSFQTLQVLVGAAQRGVVDIGLCVEVLHRSTEWGYGWIDEALRPDNPDLYDWIELVGELDDPVFLRKLDALFAEGHELLRRHIVRAWSQMDPRWVTRRLLKTLGDPRESVQDEALRGLRGSASDPTSSRLMARVEKRGLDNIALIQALGRTANPKAVGAFEKVWPTASLANRLAMLEAAAGIHTAEALTFLFEGTIAREAVLRERAAELLSAAN